ncbi:MAG: hypothetical protein ACRD0J_04720 [Acidimicrobiales bacterium]
MGVGTDAMPAVVAAHVRVTCNVEADGEGGRGTEVEVAAMVGHGVLMAAGVGVECPAAGE